MRFHITYVVSLGIERAKRRNRDKNRGERSVKDQHGVSHHLRQNGGETREGDKIGEERMSLVSKHAHAQTMDEDVLVTRCR